MLSVSAGLQKQKANVQKGLRAQHAVSPCNVLLRASVQLGGRLVGMVELQLVVGNCKRRPMHMTGLYAQGCKFAQDLLAVI